MKGTVAEPHFHRQLRRHDLVCYVGNTRYRGAHAIYVTQKEAILSRLADADTGRELATEFVARHRMALRMMPRHIRNARQWVNLYAHVAQEGYRRAEREAQGNR